MYYKSSKLLEGKHTYTSNIEKKRKERKKEKERERKRKGKTKQRKERQCLEQMMEIKSTLKTNKNLKSKASNM